ncbi:MAG: hypothetical protein HY296_01890 [Thaumarchaeota archaeon]|nr:hypothetical protein [Nitrososphaerota archaeon]
MAVDALHALVSSAIWRAEQLDNFGLETACMAWMEVSKLEEELAKIIPAKDTEGRIARRGAVRAAFKAKDLVRAQDLVELFAKDGASTALRAEFHRMLKEEAKGLSEQFPFAARHHKPRDVQRLANLLQRRGPFLLAAS